MKQAKYLVFRVCTRWSARLCADVNTNIPLICWDSYWCVAICWYKQRERERPESDRIPQWNCSSIFARNLTATHVEVWGFVYWLLLLMTANYNLSFNWFSFSLLPGYIPIQPEDPMFTELNATLKRYITMHKQRNKSALNKHGKIITLKVANVAHHFCFTIWAVSREPERTSQNEPTNIHKRRTSVSSIWTIEHSKSVILLHVAMTEAAQRNFNFPILQSA